MRFLGQYLGAILGAISLTLFQLFKAFPNFLESFYTKGVYRLIRYVYSITLTYIPFPLLYAFILLIVYILARRIFKKKKIPILRFILNFIGWLLVVFYWSWGYNYARTPFTSRASIEVSMPDKTFLYEELMRVDSILLKVRSTLVEEDTIAISDRNIPPALQEIIRSSQVYLLLALDQPIFANPKIRQLRPKGVLLRLKTAGVYFPFVLEGHIDDGLHAVEKPYVMAHEMAHAYAFTDEGVCNFIGFMTCVNSDNSFVQYSGWLEYHGYLYKALRRNYPQVLKEMAYSLPMAVKTDLNAVRERLDRYPSIAPQLRDLFYDNYLKAQGVSDGMNSYSQITRLAYSYKRAFGSYQLRDR